MVSSKYFASFLIIFATSMEASSSNTSVESTTTMTMSTTPSTVPPPPPPGSDKEEKPPRGDPLTLQLVENSSLLLLHFYPMEDSLEMTIKFDLEQYKTSNYSNTNRTASSTPSKNDKKSAATSASSPGVGVRARKINIGFDSHEGKFVDVISISLLPFEETENHDQSKTEEETATRGVVGNDHVQDFHWSPKDGVLLPDSTQSYNLVTFNVENNGTIFSTTISRPWLTCDIQDIQFSLQPVEVWWMLEMSDGQNNDVKKMLTSNQVMFEKLEAETSTLATASSNDKEKPTGSPPTSTTDKNSVASTTDSAGITSRPENSSNGSSSGGSSAKNVTLIDKNATTSSPQGRNEENPMEKDAEILKSIKDHDFHGPVLLSMEKLLKKFNAVFVKGCATAASPMKKKSSQTPSQPLFNCSLREYKERQKEIQAYLRITGVVSPLSVMMMTRKSFTEIEPEPCPVSFDNKTTTLFNALTGGSGNDRQPKRKKNGESVGRNSVTSFHNFPFSPHCHRHYCYHYYYLVSSLIPLLLARLSS